YIEKGQTHNHHEIAQFRREDGDWCFYDGEAPKPQTVKRETPKVGRNAPCPCGSGRKYKKCCSA
nr:SEC-C metal-binding domain-containing protein [Desulfobacterales bacterium]